VQTVSVCLFLTCYQRINFLAYFNPINYRKCFQSFSNNYEFRENRLNYTEILYLLTYIKNCPHSPLFLTDFGKIRCSFLPHKLIRNFEFREKLVQWKAYFRKGPLAVTYFLILFWIWKLDKVKLAKDSQCTILISDFYIHISVHRSMTQDK
jgi:hypothetical protein